MTGLRECTAHEPTDPTRSKNRMSHRPSCRSFCGPFYTTTTRLRGLTLHRTPVDESSFTNTTDTLQNAPANLTQEPTARVQVESPPPTERVRLFASSQRYILCRLSCLSGSSPSLRPGPTA